MSIFCMENSDPLMVDSKPTVTVVPCPEPCTLGTCISVPAEYSEVETLYSLTP